MKTAVGTVALVALVLVGLVAFAVLTLGLGTSRADAAPSLATKVNQLAELSVAQGVCGIDVRAQAMVITYDVMNRYGVGDDKLDRMVESQIVQLAYDHRNDTNSYCRALQRKYGGSSS